MRIQVVAAYFRETFLAPLFLEHYEPWVDEVTLITSRRSDGKFDDVDKMNWINDAIANSRADWVVLVDMDEFIFPLPRGTDPRKLLSETKHDLFFSKMCRVWRHHTEQDIDRMAPPLWQRIHGIPDHRKPCVFRPKGAVVGVGNHDIHNAKWMSDGPDWGGAHWANADQQFWIDRETRDRGPRLTEANKSKGFGTHTLRSKEQIVAECEAHKNDPVILQRD